MGKSGQRREWNNPRQIIKPRPCPTSKKFVSRWLVCLPATTGARQKQTSSSAEEIFEAWRGDQNCEKQKKAKRLLPRKRFWRMIIRQNQHLVFQSIVGEMSEAGVDFDSRLAAKPNPSFSSRSARLVAIQPASDQRERRLERLEKRPERKQFRKFFPGVGKKLLNN